MNNFTGVGRLVRDPELRYTKTNNKEVCKFTIAINDSYNKDRADFLNCVAWGKTAENISKFFTKGRMIGVVGSVKTGSYDKEDGTKVYTTDINVSQFSFCDSAKDNNTGPGANSDDGFYPVDDGEEDLPF